MRSDALLLRSTPCSYTYLLLKLWRMTLHQNFLKISSNGDSCLIRAGLRYFLLATKPGEYINIISTCKSSKYLVL